MAIVECKLSNWKIINTKSHQRLNCIDVNWGFGLSDTLGIAWATISIILVMLVAQLGFLFNSETNIYLYPNYHENISSHRRRK